MILVSMERGDPILPWYQTIILWARQFQVHEGGGNHPLVNRVTKKRLDRTRVNVFFFKSQFDPKQIFTTKNEIQN